MHSDVRYLLPSYGTQRLWHAGGRDQEVAAFLIHFLQFCFRQKYQWARGFMLSRHVNVVRIAAIVAHGHYAGGL